MVRAMMTADQCRARARFARDRAAGTADRQVRAAWEASAAGWSAVVAVAAIHEAIESQPANSGWPAILVAA